MATGSLLTCDWGFQSSQDRRLAVILANLQTQKPGHDFGYREVIAREDPWGEGHSCLVGHP
jgi:hypothetical protein